MGKILAEGIGEVQVSRGEEKGGRGHVVSERKDMQRRT